MSNFNLEDIVGQIWKLTIELNGVCKENEYGNFILPFFVLKRFDSMLIPTKEKVLNEHSKLNKKGIQNTSRILVKITKVNFFNLSRYDISTLLDDSDNILANITHYISLFSDDIVELFSKFKINDYIQRLDEKNKLYKFIQELDSKPIGIDELNSKQVEFVFEELIRLSFEHNNAAELYTPRDVVKLVVQLLLSTDHEELSQDGKIITIYDPVCGTGGLLNYSRKFIQSVNQNLQIELYGQEIDPKTFAICNSFFYLVEDESAHIFLGETISEDKSHRNFKYMIANPPFGKNFYKKNLPFAKDECNDKGSDGRFSEGVPDLNAGALLFLQHMISKMKNLKKDNESSRIAMILNASPFFTGDAGNGTCEIRKRLIEEDLIEAIIAIPGKIYYNTDIFTYIWIINNKKCENRKDKIQLVNGIDFFTLMSKSKGKKQYFLSENNRNDILRLYINFHEDKYTKIFESDYFGYNKVKIERPLRIQVKFTEELKKSFEKTDFFVKIENEKSKKKTPFGKEKQKIILKILKDFDSEKDWRNIPELRMTIEKKFKNEKIQDKKLFDFIVKYFSTKSENYEICMDGDYPIPDKDLDDYEYIPLNQDIEEYFQKEVKPFVNDGQISIEKPLIGYEIPFTKIFWKYEQIRDKEIIADEIELLDNEIINSTKKILGRDEK